MLGEEVSMPNWELLILDATPPAGSLGSLAAGDIDGDGRVEIVIGGSGALLWYRPDTFEHGLVAEGTFQVGLIVEDVDGDGRAEIVAGRADPGQMIVCYKHAGDSKQPWVERVVDAHCSASIHDLMAVDLDGDGALELLATACYGAGEQNGTFAYKFRGGWEEGWLKHTIGRGVFAEGTSAGDLCGDGRTHVMCGPYWYEPPADGPFSGPWRRRISAPAFREMCRTALVDVTGDGTLDLVVVESEFPDGRLSWFENCIRDDADEPWVERRIDPGNVFTFAHSLQAWNEPRTGDAHFFMAEMAEGGWDAPRNRDARLLHYSTADGGRTWQKELIYRGTGTHEAMVSATEAGRPVGVFGKEWLRPKVQLWRRRDKPSPLTRYRHRLLDRDKPYTATDIFPCDVDGDGRQDVVCGAWWYRNGDWRRFDIPGIYQAHCAYDLDGDGRKEIIASKGREGAEKGHPSLGSEFCWLKPLDPVAGQWEEHAIGTGDGDWAHGTLVAPVLPGGRLALVVGYHYARHGSRPQLFEMPDDPAGAPWPKRVLADILYGEEFVACDLDGDGRLDLVAGPWWLRNLGDGTFEPVRLADVSGVARIRVADVNGDGHADVVYVVESVDWSEARTAHQAAVGWLENPGDPARTPWEVHVIDKVRSPHSLDLADLDGDGELEVVVGEHDPFKPYRNRCRLFVYKKADPDGRAWARYVLDDRFEHHDGTQVIDLGGGRLGIVSHGWQDSRYVHLWEPC